MLPTVDNLGLRKKSVCQVQSVLWNSKRVSGTQWVCRLRLQCGLSSSVL